MSAQIIDGKALSQTVLAGLSAEVAGFPTPPGLAVILVGNDPASALYVKNKQKACDQIGVRSLIIDLPADTSPETLLATVDRLNADPTVNGILCQFPLPGALKSLEDEITRRILPVKDVDGLHPLSPFLPCTPQGVMKLLAKTGKPLAGLHAVVVGRSKMGGKPIADLLLAADATVTITHSKTIDLVSFTRQADVLIVSVGKPRLITADMVKAGAIVIDVGINRLSSGLVGDVDFDPLRDVASYITPVPGGVGPMTIAMLLENVVQAYRLQFAPAAPLP